MQDSRITSFLHILVQYNTVGNKIFISLIILYILSPYKQLRLCRSSPITHRLLREKPCRHCRKEVWNFMMHLALITHFNRLNCDRVWLLDVSAAAAAPPGRDGWGCGWIYGYCSKFALCAALQFLLSPVYFCLNLHSPSLADLSPADHGSSEKHQRWHRKGCFIQSTAVTLFTEKLLCFLIYLFYSYYYFLKINGYMTHTKAEPMRFYNSPLFPPLGCFPWLSEKWWHLSHMLYLFRGCILSESELVFILKK